MASVKVKKKVKKAEKPTKYRFFIYKFDPKTKVVHTRGLFRTKAVTRTTLNGFIAKELADAGPNAVADWETL